MARERWCESLSDQVTTLPGLPGSEQGVGMKQTVPQHPPLPHHALCCTVLNEQRDCCCPTLYRVASVSLSLNLIL